MSQYKSLALDWLRSLPPPASFSSLGRTAAEYKSQGWNPQQNAGAFILGNSKILEVQWRDKRGEFTTAYVLWPLGSAEFEHALRTLLRSERKLRIQLDQILLAARSANPTTSDTEWNALKPEFATAAMAVFQQDGGPIGEALRPALD